MIQQNITVQQHPASADAYLRHGWSLVPVPFGTKGPVHKGWNLHENRIAHSYQLEPNSGIGLAHAWSGTMALDIDDWGDAVTELANHGINLQLLYDAPDAVVIDSGRSGHGKLLYAMPLGARIPSKKLIKRREDGSSYNYLDFRCSTSNGVTVQDVLPPSIHPDTGKPYQWAGKGHWTRLPIIPIELLAFWQKMLEEEKRRVLPALDAVDVSWAEVESAIEFIPADTNREEWIRVGMALHWAGTQIGAEEKAFNIWNQWSATAKEKYPGEKAVYNQWKAFRSDKHESVTFGTLFHIAKFHGWTRPEIDASSLFPNVSQQHTPRQMIDALRPKAPDVPLDVWPDILKTRALEVSESVGCDPLVPLLAGLSAVSAAADAESRLMLVEGFKVPPVIWTMTIGEPADKKSPGSIPMLKILKEIENEDRPRFKNAMTDWEGREAAYAASKKAFIDFASSEDYMLGVPPPPVLDLPPQPVPLRLTVSDVTSQKLVRQASERSRGFLCYLDEMNAWVRKVTDKMGGEDRSTWVMSYEARSYDMDRVGAGSIHCENLAVAIYGNIQPRVFRDNIDALSSDGLIQRFIPAVLRSNKTKMGNPIPDYLTSDAKWSNTIRLIQALPKLEYKLSPDAYAVFREFQHWYEQAKVDERMLNSDQVFMTALGKIEGTTGRLIFLFHLLENPFSNTVNEATTRRAIALVKQFVIPSFRFSFSEMVGRDSFDSWLIEHIVSIADEQQATLTEIKRAARKWLDGLSAWQQDQTVISSMEALSRLEWVRRGDDGKMENRHAAFWYINPSLTTMFKDYRDEVVAAKERQKQRYLTK